MGALTLLSAALSAAGGLAAAQAQAQAADFDAEIAQQQARRERDIAARDAARQRREGSRALAAARARRAGSGVEAAGTPLLREEDLAAAIEEGAQDILTSGAARAAGRQQQAALSRFRARSARRDGVLRSGRTLLTGLGQGSYGGSGLII